MNMKHIICFILIIMFFASVAGAENLYVNGDVKITLRTGPGIDHKIIAMIKSGDEVNLIERGVDWTRIKLKSGKEGWAHSRFLTANKPCNLLIKNVRHQNELLESNSNALVKENGNLKLEKQDLMIALEQIKKQFDKLKLAYDAYKNEYGDFFKLKDDYNIASANLKKQVIKVNDLEKELKSRSNSLLFFIFGAGILLIGVVIGLASRRKERNYNTLR